MKNKRERADLADEEKQEREIQRQIERAEQMMETMDSTAADGKNEEGNKSRMLEKNKEDADKEIMLSLGSSAKNAHEKKDSLKLLFDEEEFKSKKRKRKQKYGNKSVKNESALDELMKEEEKANEQSNRKDHWLFEGIFVKVMSKALADKGYYKQKGVVRNMIDKNVGEIEMLENKHVLRVDQDELETVIPQIGGLVKIVNGAYRGENARLLAIYTERFYGKVGVEKGLYDGRVLKAVEYEDLCKLVQ